MKELFIVTGRLDQIWVAKSRAGSHIYLGHNMAQIQITFFFLSDKDHIGQSVERGTLDLEIELAQGAGTPRPISIQNQVADGFEAFVGYIVAHFVPQMSLLRE